RRPGRRRAQVDRLQSRVPVLGADADRRGRRDASGTNRGSARRRARGRAARRINPIPPTLRILGSMRILLAAVAGALLLVLPGGAGAQSPTLFGTVGLGFLIRLQDAAGNPV